MKTKKISPRLSINTIATIVIVGLVLGYLITKYGMETSTANLEKRSESKQLGTNIATSPTGRYLLRFHDGSSFGKVEMVTPDKPVELSDLPAVNQSGMIFSKSNIVWSENEEITIITTLDQVGSNSSSLSAWIYFLESKTGNLIYKHDLGSGGFYGINQNQAFKPVISPNNKFVAVQTDLIHSFTIFDVYGKFIKKVPTVFEKVELFSDEMYQLEDGQYSPFLEYYWNQDNQSLSYHFRGETSTGKVQIHKLDIGPLQ